MHFSSARGWLRWIDFVRRAVSKPFLGAAVDWVPLSIIFDSILIRCLAQATHSAVVGVGNGRCSGGPIVNYFKAMRADK